MHASGVLWDSDRASCYVISIGCTISTCSTTHPPLIPTHLNLSPMAVTLSFHSGCQTQTEAPLTLNDQPSTIPREVTLRSLIRFLRTSPFSCYYKRRPPKSGYENLTGLLNMG